MNKGIEVTHELRPCYVSVGGTEEKALFHSFSCADGCAVVEFEDGSCATATPLAIRFIDNKVSEYAINDNTGYRDNKPPCEYCARERKPINWKYCPECGRKLGCQILV